MAKPDSAGPIGLFDSGVGGLSIWREIVRQLPYEDTVYIADQAHVPYGSRQLAEVRAFSEGIVQFLLRSGAKVVVVACNTASAAALHYLRARFPDVPFVGMEPAVKPAVEHTRTQVVGVLATPATFHGKLFVTLVDRYGGDVRVLTQTCPGLVEAVETGALDGAATEALLRACLAPLLGAGIDQLVLGCTHYPFLAPLIERIVGPGVTLVDPAPAVARQTVRVLNLHGLHRAAPEPVACSEPQAARHVFCTSGGVAEFTSVLERLAPSEGRAREIRALRWNQNGVWALT